MIIKNKIGYGTWPLAGNVNGTKSYGITNDKDSITALNRALELGVTLFDTSDFYGFGHVEKMLGKVVKHIRDKVCIVTKGGFTSSNTQNFDEVYLQQSLFSSLGRLQTDYVDVYLLHNPPMSAFKNSKLLQTMEFFVNCGHVRQYGISLQSPIDGIEAINEYGFKAIEVNYNILDHRAETCGLFNLCKEKNVFVIIKTPLAQGLLGNFSFNDDLSDIRNTWKKETVSNLTAIYKKMMLVLNHNVYTDAQNCLRFCLTNNAINVIIPGMKLEKEVNENVLVSTFPVLTKSEIVAIRKIYEENNL